MRFFVLATIATLWCAACGVEPCGTLEGDATIRNSSDAEQYACHTRITKDLSVNANEGLSNFEVPHLVAIDGDLRIIYNYVLKRFDLGSLVYVRGNVEIEGNSLLPDLNGLRNLSYIGGSLYIRSMHGERLNGELADIDGLGSVESIAGDIWIENNPKLPTCAAEALVEQLVYFLGTTMISGNDSSATCE